MTVNTLTHVEWRRFHDPLLSPIRADIETVHCADNAADFIEICHARPATGRKLKAAGSHWSLSKSTLSDNVALETNWPDADTVPRNTGLDIDMSEIISMPLFEEMVKNPPVAPDAATSDPCQRDDAKNCFFIHLKSGTRIYEAYSLMDSMAVNPTGLAQKLNERLAGSLNARAYDGPWGFMTLGGAGGQTVFGALTTGTHGGDFRQRPISDAVVALHLVTDGGNHFWIEPRTSAVKFPIADDKNLKTKYGNLHPSATFKIIRDNDIFNSVVIGVGRFGVVVSIVLRVVPQYCLLEHRRLSDWSSIKALLKAPKHHHAFDFAFFREPDAAQDKAKFAKNFPAGYRDRNRFLQIAINPTPHGHDDHRCGVTQRWFYPNTKEEAFDPKSNELRGRNERGIFKIEGKADTAGTTTNYEPPDTSKNSGSSSGTFLSKACGNGSFLIGLLRQTLKEIEQVIADNAVVAGGVIAGALAIGTGSAVTAVGASLCPILAAIVLALAALAAALEKEGDNTSLAQAADTIIKAIDAIPGVPTEFKVMLLRVVFKQLFESQQSDRDYVAISYAVMDGHDYLDRSCFANAESIEIFFDASRPDVYCAFVDAALAFEAAQEEHSMHFTVGYISLRYVGGSRALLSPAQFNETVAIEISGIRDASGSVPFIMNAVSLARHPMFAGCFHWGQFNPLTRAEVEKLYDAAPALRLSRWRNSLQQLTKNGTLDGFSSEFTRQVGLEPF
ncbi:MAG: hypothetical protein EOO38_03285 [Cytophagaceae bacterium]|nr:MAG: hypothetical protein EOO38_03285 [Cytophagaceae bacterium]